MADYNSTQKAQLAANSSDLLRPAEQGGRVRVASFDFTVPAGGVATAKSVALCNIPAGATIIGGALAHNDVGNKITIGDATSADKFSGEISMAAASTASVEFANTLAKNAGLRITSASELTGYSVGAWTAGKVIRGAVFYCVD